MRLVMEHLSKQFKNRIAVESIDTELREGVYGFLGANGAGKTTLMQMICGIIEPTAGEVKINGDGLCHPQQTPCHLRSDRSPSA